MCRGGALYETVSYIWRHLSFYPNETPTCLVTIWWLCTYEHLSSLISLLLIPHPIIWQISLNDWLLLSYTGWYSIKISCMDLATLICCLTLSTHKPWSTMSSSRLVCTKDLLICLHACMYLCTYFTWTQCVLWHAFVWIGGQRSPGVDPKQLAAELQKVSQQQAPGVTGTGVGPGGLGVLSALERSALLHSGTGSAASSGVPSPGQPTSPAISKKQRHKVDLQFFFF